MPKGNIVEIGLKTLGLLKSKLKLILFCIVSSQVLFTAVFSDPLIVAGDGVEYVLLGEAIVNHGTPEIRVEDVESYISESTKYPGWAANPKNEAFSELKEFLLIENKSFLQGHSSIHMSKSGLAQAIHFSTYTYFVAGFKILLNTLPLHPMDCFFIANAVLILGVLFVILFYLPLPKWFSLFFSGIFYFSAVQWYLLWTHPEVFVACLTVLGLCFLRLKEKY